MSIFDRESTEKSMEDYRKGICEGYRKGRALRRAVEEGVISDDVAVAALSSPRTDDDDNKFSVVKQ